MAFENPIPGGHDVVAHGEEVLGADGVQHAAAAQHVQRLIFEVEPVERAAEGAAAPKKMEPLMRTILSCGQSGKPVLALNAGGIWPGTRLTSSTPGPVRQDAALQECVELVRVNWTVSSTP